MLGIWRLTVARRWLQLLAAIAATVLPAACSAALTSFAWNIPRSDPRSSVVYFALLGGYMMSLMCLSVVWGAPERIVQEQAVIRSGDIARLTLLRRDRRIGAMLFVVGMVLGGIGVSSPPSMTPTAIISRAVALWLALAAIYGSVWVGLLNGSLAARESG